MDSTTVSQEIFSRIDLLAGKLNIAVEHLYGVLVTQGMVEGYSMLVFGVLMLLLVVFGGWRGYRLIDAAQQRDREQIAEYNKRLWDRGRDSFYNKEHDAAAFNIARILLGIALFIFGLFGLLDVITAVGYIINPEWWALEYILDAMK